MSFSKALYRRMNEQILWMLAQHTHEKSSNAYEQSQLLMELLSKWSVPHILKFEALYWDLMKRSYHADLWAAAYVLNDGCSPSDFLHFRSWLLLQGQSIFKRAIEDPESLLEWIDFPFQNPILYPDLENKIAELIAMKTHTPVQMRFSEKDFELEGDYWRNDLDIVDKVPVLCRKMGWGNQVAHGEWKTDDTPLYNSSASNGFY